MSDIREEVSRLYQQYGREVYNFLIYFTGDRQSAEDVLQETFLRLLKSRSRFEGRAKEQTWIFQIAKNTAIDWYRRQRPDYPVGLTSWQQQEDTTQHTPEENVLARERAREIQELLGLLKPHYRAVVILRALRECSIAEMAAIMGWSEGKVKTTYHRALTALSKYSREKGVTLHAHTME